MRRAGLGVAAALALAGCIPQVDPPYRGAPHPPIPTERARPEEQPVTPPPAADGASPDVPDPGPEQDRAASLPGPSDEALPLTAGGHPVAESSYTVGGADLARGRSTSITTSKVSRARPGPVGGIHKRPDQDITAARPSWEMHSVEADARTVVESRYIVRRGDTLSRIAERSGASEAAIAAANGLEPPFAVHPGQRLTIPGGRYHLIRPGQSGIAVARAYGVPWSRIVAANGLTDPYVLRAGQRVLIPSPPAGSTSLAERAAAFTLDVDDILTGGEPAQAAGEPPARPAKAARRSLPPTALVLAPPRLRGGFMWPVDGPVVQRFRPGVSGPRGDGIAIAVPIDTPIRAVADGVVAYAGSGIATLGNLLIIKHGNRWASVYGHAARFLVRRGDDVKRGQVVARSGDSGSADQPELHFELRKGRTPVDPEGELPRS